MHVRALVPICTEMQCMCPCCCDTSCQIMYGVHVDWQHCDHYALTLVLQQTIQEEMDTARVVMAQHHSLPIMHNRQSNLQSEGPQRAAHLPIGKPCCRQSARSPKAVPAAML